MLGEGESRATVAVQFDLWKLGEISEVPHFFKWLAFI